MAIKSILFMLFLFCVGCHVSVGTNPNAKAEGCQEGIKLMMKNIKFIHDNIGYNQFSDVWDKCDEFKDKSSQSDTTK